jgi:hypothetical protein
VKNSTFVTLILSEEFVVIVCVFATVEPDVGDVIETVGEMVSSAAKYLTATLVTVPVVTEIFESVQVVPLQVGASGNVEAAREHSVPPSGYVQVSAASVYPAMSETVTVWVPVSIEESVTGFIEEEIPASTCAVVPAGAVAVVKSEPTRFIMIEPEDCMYFIATLVTVPALTDILENMQVVPLHVGTSGNVEAAREHSVPPSGYVQVSADSV